jgi:hypothetical protein|nr:MAG TPA: hypothetical protein [Caudoviricetes sp.]
MFNLFKKVFAVVDKKDKTSETILHLKYGIEGIYSMLEQDEKKVISLSKSQKGKLYKKLHEYCQDYEMLTGKKYGE